MKKFLNPPQTSTYFWRVRSGMVFGLDLHYIIVYGSVCNSEDWILHGFSARIFCFFVPRDGFLSPGLDFWISGQHFGSGTFFDQCWGPKKHEFAKKSFCGGLVGQSLLPKWILWYLGSIWVCYFAPKPLYSKNTCNFSFPGKLGSPPAYFPWWLPIFLGGSCGALWHNVSPWVCTESLGPPGCVGRFIEDMYNLAMLPR